MVAGQAPSFAWRILLQKNLDQEYKYRLVDKDSRPACRCFLFV